MITRSRERVFDASENTFSIVFYLAGFSMHELLRADYSSAERVNYSLVPEAHAQGWDIEGHVLEDFGAHAEVSGFFRCSGSWRNYYPVRLEHLNLFQGYFVVSLDDRVR